MWIPRFLRRILNLTDIDGGRVSFQRNSVSGLEITVESGWDKFIINISSTEADKLLVWMNQTKGRPRTDANKSATVLPLFRTTSDSERGPRSPRT